MVCDRVFFFRSGKRTARTRTSLSSYDLIEGPMATVMRSERTDQFFRFSSL